MPIANSQGVVEEMEAVGRRVRHGGRGTQHPGLAPAARGDTDVRTALHRVPDGDREGGEAEAVRAGTVHVDQGEVQGRQEGDGVRRNQAGAVTRGVQDEPGEPVDRLVAGDHRAPVVGDEPGAARPSGEITDPHQGPVRGLDHVRRLHRVRCVGVVRGLSRVRRLGCLRRLGCVPGSDRQLMTAPGPRAPSRHARTSPPRASHRATDASSPTVGAR
ncbi:hypothetical protein ACRJ4B_16300 [Streptomyces sp. GTA36]